MVLTRSGDEQGSSAAVPAADVTDVTEPIIGPFSAGQAREAQPIAAPRLARHVVTLSDGHQIGLAVSGRGVPLVVIHGFSAEGFLYAQTLSRLVAKGFKVVALDMAGHGGSQGLPSLGRDLGDYAELLGRTLDELGIGSTILAGHSMGGRVVAQLAATRPERTIGVLLVDAIVGDQWDLMVMLNRANPIFYAGLGGLLMLDTVSTLPVFRDPVQAMKLGRLVTPTLISHVLQPWRLVGGVASIFRSRSSRHYLETLAAERVPVFVLHGDRDVAIPICTARSAARRAHGELITVAGGTHSWLLKDPETLPAIVDDLLEDSLGDAIRNVLGQAGAASVEEIESLLYEQGAPILALTPEPRPTRSGEKHRRPRYRWERSAER